MLRNRPIKIGRLSMRPLMQACGSRVSDCAYLSVPLSRFSCLKRRLRRRSNSSKTRVEAPIMAEPASDQQATEQQNVDSISEAEQQLKHLEFFHVAAIQALVLLSRLYGFAKESSGPLKPGVQAVEGTVSAVVGPVYDKFHDLPYEILKFVDRKVDAAVIELDRRVPPTVKNLSSGARSIADGVHRDGVVPTATSLAKNVVSTCEPAVKKIYGTCEPVAEQYAVATWQTLNRLPLFPQVAQVAVPTAAHWADKYNSAVVYAAENGYSAAAYLPSVPVDRISKIFSAGGQTAGESH